MYVISKGSYPLPRICNASLFADTWARGRILTGTMQRLKIRKNKAQTNLKAIWEKYFWAD